MPDRPGQLAEAVPPGASLLIDSSVVLSYLTGAEASSARAEELFDAYIATGRNPASLSMVTVAEILVRPFRRGPAAVATAEAFLQHFADIRLVPVTYDVAREGARLRASTDLPMPDALIIASGLVVGADAIVTDDRTWRMRLRDAVPNLQIIQLTA
ncbi:MAG TPA: PIN domain-containing protein [Candidatus Limnocylindrales bacterium]|nr:PIN domain-containing protein [Candidatus Limnocylindrales bacterium]